MMTAAPTTPEITILITAHNEAERIPASLQAILAQDFPMERVEIILVDDRSTDGTADIARQLNIPGLRILQLRDKPQGLTARQVAVHLGIGEARGEIILLTDAGGRVPREWLRELIGHLGFRDGAVTAPVVFAGPRWFLNTYQTIDALVQFTLYRWLHSHRKSAGLFGANVAIRRETYEELGGYPAVGFQLVEDAALGVALTKSPWSVRYIPEPFVQNPGADGLGELFARERRIAAGPTPGYHRIIWAMMLSNLLCLAAAIYFQSRFWDLLLLARYVAGMLVLGFSIGRYPKYQSGFWMLFYEPLKTLLGVCAYTANAISPHWQWGGLRYSKQGPE
jgi:cellulose synthase/poly-beta-1,6-N-acetylglucosamine synthase-like glycosyltransferase